MEIVYHNGHLWVTGNRRKRSLICLLILLRFHPLRVLEMMYIGHINGYVFCFIIGRLQGLQNLFPGKPFVLRSEEPAQYPQDRHRSEDDTRLYKSYMM